MQDDSFSRLPSLDAIAVDSLDAAAPSVTIIAAPHDDPIGGPSTDENRWRQTADSSIAA